MICLRNKRHLILSQTRFMAHGDIYKTKDLRKVFYNKQKETLENWKMVKELEVPNYNTNSEKPGRGTIERFVPRIPTVPVKKVAPNQDQLPSHKPLAKEEYLCQGELFWKKSDGCVLCNNNIHVSYKNVAFLYQFVTDSGRIMGPHSTGLCHLSHQVVTDCIATARELGIMAHDYKPLEFSKNGVIQQPGVKDVGH